MKISKLMDALRLNRLKRQSNPIAAAAVRAITAKGFPVAPSMCQMFARLVYESVYGSEFEFAHKPTALQAAHAFRAHGFDVPLEGGAQPGDLLYRLSGNGGFGHVGIYLAGGMVAENSVVHAGDGDARGLRTLREFGDFDMIVRLHR